MLRPSSSLVWRSQLQGVAAAESLSSRVAVMSRNTTVNNGDNTRPIRLAILHQAVEPPAVDGLKKAMKPGGYKDSAADIAYALQQSQLSNASVDFEIEVVTPEANLVPFRDDGWSFPDTESGILSAIKHHKASHIWANTVLFASHPLQTSKELMNDGKDLYVIGQPPVLVQKYDDKNWVNTILKQDTRFDLPSSWIVNTEHISTNSSDTGDLISHLRDLNLPYPVVGKPIRGRGSHGVKLCNDIDELGEHLNQILIESPQVMIEEFLAGQEGTVTVMPPSPEKSGYWSLPFVERFNHHEGVAPYNGVVAVMQNSRVVPLNVQAYDHLSHRDGDHQQNVYVQVRRQCEMAAEKLGCTAPIRIDVRQRRKTDNMSDKDNGFVLFDVNMKPNMTGPGRPNRENQASLTAMAAESLGWDYPTLLKEMIKTARPLRELRKAKIPVE